MHRSLLCLCLCLACDHASPAGDEPEGGTSSDGSSSDGTTGEPLPESSSEAEASTDGARLDVAPPQDMSCQKIDFVFVIDNSGSMTDEQARLIDGFPGFIADIEASIQQYDYHMMVVTTDPWPAGDVCDATTGAGHTTAADGTECGLDSTDRFADAEDDEDLAAVFECVADVGTEGSGNEQPIWALAQAITMQSYPGGCNAGFLRDDAILVATIITDEEDNAMADSPGDPPLWREVVVAAKNGDDEAIVMLGLLGDTDLPDAICGAPNPEDGGGAEPAPRLRTFVESFPHGRWASVCQDDYAPFFNEAIADIGKACIDFVPPA